MNFYICTEPHCNGKKGCGVCDNVWHDRVKEMMPGNKSCSARRDISGTNEMKKLIEKKCNKCSERFTCWTNERKEEIWH